MPKLCPLMGPKLSAFCMIMSAWGVVFLGILGVFFHTQDVTLFPDLHLNEEADMSTAAIKHCEWYLKTFSNEGFHSDFNPRKISVYRPLTVSRALEQLYGPIPEDRIILPNDVLIVFPL